ncbi:hypothetical protein PT974_01775 [Cladobotryum mycophilum]|uniref:F-box domain-containing protein n=1 Tax=Cladobotryum mycophilum TaxID=491253 RepID=A0ABR0SXH5_9HYPO
MNFPNTITTPAWGGTPGLYKLPPELWDRIASFSDFESLLHFSCISKHCRAMLVRHIFYSISFYFHNSSSMRTFASPDDADLANVRSHVKHLKIALACRHYYGFGWNWGTNVSLQEICKSIQLTRNLQRLSLELGGLNRAERREFATLLASCDKWRMSQLEFGRTTSIASMVLRKCVAGHLRTLHLDSWIGSQPYNMAAKHQGGLRRLRLYGSSRKAGQGRLIPSIHDAALQKILLDFKYIEWLSISDMSQDLKCIPIQDFNNGLGASLATLKGFQHLRRLAFRLGSPSRNLMSGTLVTTPAGSNQPTTHLRTWHERLIRRISGELPGLREICILQRRSGRFIRATRVNAGDVMVISHGVELLHDHAPASINWEKRFPIGLYD